MNIGFPLVSHYPHLPPKKKKWMNEWKKSFILSEKLELFLNNTENSRHLQPQDMHYGAFPQLIILNMMWTNSPWIFLWSIIQLLNEENITVNLYLPKNFTKLFIPTLSSMCFIGPISSEWITFNVTECVNFLSSGTKQIIKKGVINIEWLN